MSDRFDPYHRWLSIPTEEQPPHHYRLLGLKLFESDPDVIESGADRQMAHVRNFQGGRHAEFSQRILNEIAAARLVLLDADRKAAYDGQLRAKLEPPTAARNPQPPLATAQPLAVAQPLAASPTMVQPQPRPQRSAAAASPTATAPVDVHPRAAKAGLSKPVLHTAVACAAALLLGAVVLWATTRRDDPAVAAGDAASVNPPTTEQGGAANTDPAATGADSPSSAEAAPDASPAPPPRLDAGDQPAAKVADDPPDSSGDLPPAIPEAESIVEAPSAGSPGGEPTEPAATDDDEPGELDENPVAPADPGPRKLPVPDKDARDRKRREISAIFPLDQARTPQEKADLAAQLLRTARETLDDPPAQFALLNLAREHAVEAGQIRLAFEAIDVLAEVFDFNPDTVRVLSLQEAAKASAPPAAKRDVVVLGMQVVEGFVAADEFDKAAALAERLLGVARPLRDAELLKAVVEQRRTADALAAEFRKAKTAFEVLNISPDDAAANLAAGRYQVFIKQDWEAGLPHLAKGSDEALASAAKLEMAVPDTLADQEKLADAWWDAAEAEKDPKAKNLCRARGGMWYREVVSELSGLAKARVERRIAEAGEWTGPRRSRPKQPSAAPLRAPLEGLVAHWSFDEGEGTVARDSVAGHEAILKGATWTDGVQGRALSFSGQGAIAVSQGPKLDSYGQLTLAAWVRPRSLGDRQSGIRNVVAHVVTAGGWREVFLRHSEGANGMFYSGGVSNLKVRIASTPVPREEVDDWGHLAATHDGQAWRLYRNGILVSSTDSTVEDFTLAGAWFIGGDVYRGGRRYFHGDIDELRIYNRALSPQEVAALHAAATAASGPRYDSAGTLLPDLSAAAGEPAAADQPVEDRRGIEWIALPESSVCSRCVALGEFPYDTADQVVLNFLAKAKVGEELAGRKLSREVAEEDGKFRGPLAMKTKKFYMFRVRSDKQQPVLLQAETFTRWQHSTVNVLVNFRPAPANGQVLLAKGENVVIVKQNHDHSDRSDRSWITLSLTGENLLIGY